jgi:hypothetical protein
MSQTPYQRPERNTPSIPRNSLATSSHQHSLSTSSWRGETLAPDSPDAPPQCSSNEDETDLDLPLLSNEEQEETLSLDTELAHKLSSSLVLPRVPTPPSPSPYTPSGNIFASQSPILVPRPRSPLTTMSKPVELCISPPESYDGNHRNTLPWLQSISRYLLINKEIYNTDNRKVCYALSFMKSRNAATWADTYTAKYIDAGRTSLGSWADFVKEFKASFEHSNSAANALAWLTTQWMIEKSPGKYSMSLAQYIS